jgi:hypothetical protein
LGDLANLAGVVQSEEDAARKARKLYPLIRQYQDAFLEIEKVLQIDSTLKYVTSNVFCIDE